MFAYCNNNPIMHRDDTGYSLHPTTMVMKDGGSGYRKKDVNTRRDVTDEVTKALTKAAGYARVKRLACEQSLFDTTFALKDVYAEFYSLVNHEADWDIKRQAPWEKTIGTEYPGYNVGVTFCGGVVTPEHLGNFTYGYLGQAYDIPLIVLLGGSYCAADFPTETDDLLNELKDWYHIAIGYAFAEKGI